MGAVDDGPAASDPCSHAANIPRFFCTVNVFGRTMHLELEPGEAVVVDGVLEGDAPPSKLDPVPEDEPDVFVPGINEGMSRPRKMYCVGVLKMVGS